MIRFILARLGVLIPTFIGVTFVAFILIRLVPGDPVEVLAGERGIDARAARPALAPARPRPADLGAVPRYRRQRVLHGDFGRSIVTQRAGAERVLRRCSRRRSSSRCVAMLFAIVIGLPAGIFAAVRRGRSFDQASWARR